MLLNKIGDFGLLIGIFLIIFNFKAVDYATVASLTPYFKTTLTNFSVLNVDNLETIAFFMFVGAIAKSAQLGLHT